MYQAIVSSSNSSNDIIVSLKFHTNFMILPTFQFHNQKIFLENKQHFQFLF